MSDDFTPVACMSLLNAEDLIMELMGSQGYEIFLCSNWLRIVLIVGL